MAHRKDSRIAAAVKTLTVSEAGMGSVMLLTLLPLLLAVIVVVLYVLSTQHALLEARQTCRKKLISFEKTSADQLMTLERLNLMIRHLRIEDLALKAELTVAIATENVPAAIALKQKMELVRQKLIQIDFQQKRILNQNQLLANDTRFQVTSDIYNSERSLGSLLRGFLTVEAQTPRARLSPLAVLPDKPNTIAPIYEREEPFIEKQSSQVFWKMRIYVHSNSWATRWFQSSVTWEDSCGASLQKEGLRWQQTLVTTKKDRY